MKKYETIYIVRPDLADDDVKSLTEKLQELVVSMKGDMKRLEDWGLRKLAYPIQKSNRGRYFYLRFDGAPGLVAELERRMRLDDKIVRYQTVIVEKEIEAPAAAEKKAAPAEEPAAEAPAVAGE